MTVTIPESHLDLIAGPYFAVLTTIAADGQPENTVVWCSWDGSNVLVNTASDRRKTVNVAQNPLVALTVLDPQDSGRWVDVRGTVDEIVPDSDYANINAHCKLYTGRDEFYDRSAPASLKGKQQRVIFKIRPTRVVVS